MKMFESFNRQVTEYAGEIDERNRRTYIIFSSGALFLSSVVFIASALIPAYHVFLLSHGFLFLYSCFLFYFSRRCSRKKEWNIKLVMYLSFAPLLFGAVLLGTYFDPMKPAISIDIFICILPLFIIDRPARIIGHQLLFAALFVFMSHSMKPLEVFQEDVLYLPIYLSLGIGANVFTLMERIESVKNNALLRHESEHDALTMLLNRRSGEEKMKLLFEENVHGTFAIADVDEFKTFNDCFGHQVGDDVLKGISEAMMSVFRSSDVIWRLGGDEFAIFAVNLTDPEICTRKFQVLMSQIAKMELPEGVNETVSISVGCTVCSDIHLNFDDVYHASDEALYQAKSQGRGKIVFHE
jgi:diguanylate cyclase (GGDEF) domain